MGNAWVVMKWVVDDNGDYNYAEVYRGESALVAFWKFLRARKGSGCVKIEWR